MTLEALAMKVVEAVGSARVEFIDKPSELPKRTNPFSSS
jgi:hypothetical protein